MGLSLGWSELGLSDTGSYYKKDGQFLEYAPGQAVDYRPPRHSFAPHFFGDGL